MFCFIVATYFLCFEFLVGQIMTAVCATLEGKAQHANTKPRLRKRSRSCSCQKLFTSKIRFVPSHTQLELV